MRSLSRDEASFVHSLERDEGGLGTRARAGKSALRNHVIHHMVHGSCF